MDNNKYESYLLNNDLDPTEKIMMMVYRSLAADGRVCSISQKETAERVNVSLSTVKRKIISLVEKRYIHRMSNVRVDGGKDWNIIKILK